MTPLEALSHVGIESEKPADEFNGIIRMDDGHSEPLSLEIFAVDEEGGTINCGALNAHRFMTIKPEDFVEMYNEGKLWVE